MTNGYLEVISLVERLHRHFLEVDSIGAPGTGNHERESERRRNLHHR